MTTKQKISYEIVDGPTERQISLAWELFRERRVVIFTIKIDNRRKEISAMVQGVVRTLTEHLPDFPEGNEMKLVLITSEREAKLLSSLVVIESCELEVTYNSKSKKGKMMVE